MHTPQTLSRVLEESPSKMDCRDSPLFTMSPSGTNSSPARSSISSRVASSATRNHLTYTMSSVVDLQPQSGPSSAASSSSTFGMHRGHALADPSKSALGLIHEGGEYRGQEHPQLDSGMSASQLSNSTRSVSFRRRTQSKGLSEKDMARHRCAPGLPPPQGPLPLPGDRPLGRTLSEFQNGYIEQSHSERGQQDTMPLRIDSKGIWPYLACRLSFIH